MAEQAGSGTMHEAAVGAGAHELVHHGKPGSWVAVTIIVIGFVVGGIGMTTGPTWWLFWAGAGITVVGSIAAAATRILDDWY